jgi:hypothetical protein
LDEKDGVDVNVLEGMRQPSCSQRWFHTAAGASKGGSGVGA